MPATWNKTTLNITRDFILNIFNIAGNDDIEINNEINSKIEARNIIGKTLNYLQSLKLENVGKINMDDCLYVNNFYYSTVFTDAIKYLCKNGHNPMSIYKAFIFNDNKFINNFDEAINQNEFIVGINLILFHLGKIMQRVEFLETIYTLDDYNAENKQDYNEITNINHNIDEIKKMIKIYFIIVKNLFYLFVNFKFAMMIYLLYFYIF